MRNYLIWIRLALGLLAFSTAHTALALEIESEVKTNFVYYPVRGANPQEIRADMNRARQDNDNGPHDGSTRWDIKWNYRYNVRDNLYVISSFKINTQITIRLPQWTPPRDADPGLVKQWNNYLRALLQHEYGHVGHGTQAAKEIGDRVKALESFKARPEVQSTLEGISSSAIGKYKRADEDYDAKTNHGIKQGAHFP